MEIFAFLYIVLICILIPIIIPLTITLVIVPPANILSSGFLGAFVIIFFSGFSNPKAIAGRESVTKLINNSCIVVNGFAQLQILQIIWQLFHLNFLQINKLWIF